MSSASHIQESINEGARRLYLAQLAVRPYAPGPLGMYRPSTATSPRVLTYRFNGELVYVPAAPDYAQAVDYAVCAFPSLSLSLGKDNADRSRIALYVTRPPLGHKVRVSEFAWSLVAEDLSNYDVVEVEVAEKEKDVATADEL